VVAVRSSRRIGRAKPVIGTRYLQALSGSPQRLSGGLPKSHVRLYWWRWGTGTEGMQKEVRSQRVQVLVPVSRQGPVLSVYDTILPAEKNRCRVGYPWEGISHSSGCVLVGECHQRRRHSPGFGLDDLGRTEITFGRWREPKVLKREALAVGAGDGDVERVSPSCFSIAKPMTKNPPSRVGQSCTLSALCMPLFVGALWAHHLTLLICSMRSTPAHLSRPAQRIHVRSC
jgi:hypothetical protein